MLKKKIIKLITAPIATLQTILIILRFIGLIDWSWWLVFSPVLIMGLLVLFFSIMKLTLRRRKK